jgi:hypothetical protein
VTDRKSPSPAAVRGKAADATKLRTCLRLLGSVNLFSDSCTAPSRLNAIPTESVWCAIEEPTFIPRQPPGRNGHRMTEYACENHAI